MVGVCEAAKATNDHLGSCVCVRCESLAALDEALKREVVEKGGEDA